jgi:hypothetical protein
MVRPLPSTALRWLVGVTALALPHCVPAASADPVLIYDEHALTVRLDGVPIDQVVELFARETGAEVRGEPADLRMVTKRFDAVPLPEALRRLLGAENFAMRYGEDGRLVAVELLGAPRPKSVDRKPRRPARPVAHRLLATHTVVGLDRDLATAVGSPNAGLPRLLEVAIENDEVPIRRRATRKLVTVVEENARLRETALAMLRETDDRALIDLVSGEGPERAQEFFATVASDAADGYVRARAWRLMRTVGRVLSPAQTPSAEIVAAGAPGV